MFADALAMPAMLNDEKVSHGKRAPQKPMNEAQFEAFYRRTSKPLWAYLYRLTGDSSATDDLLQKSFFRYLRANPPTASDEHMRRYLFRTATNLAFDHFREKKRDRAIDEALTSTPQPERGDLRHDMRRLFNELKPQERALLWLAHVEGFSHDEIAAALGLKSRSIRVLLFRARTRLAEILAKNGMGPETRS